MNDIYHLEYRTPQGKVVPLSDYRGKTLLIVNTATRCGLAPQFRELEELHRAYRDQGLVVLGFPCNQFQNQEPETNESMESACEVNFGVTFQLSEKTDVNGSNSHPLFAYLKDHLKGRMGKKIRWNFTKFLITPDGKPYKRFAPSVKPALMEKEIRKLLGL